MSFHALTAGVDLYSRGEGPHSPDVSSTVV